MSDNAYRNAQWRRFTVAVVMGENDVDTPVGGKVSQVHSSTPEHMDAAFDAACAALRAYIREHM